MPYNSLRGWRVQRDYIHVVGQDLQRPECIIAQRDGTFWPADARGGVTRLTPDGSQRLAPTDANVGEGSFEERFVQSHNAFLPNGRSLTLKGNCIICNWGLDRIERLKRNGELTVLHDHIDGKPLGKTNFPLLDSKERICFTVTTQMQPWTGSIPAKVADGYICVIDDSGIRVVADGFKGTDEIRFNDHEEWLYVVESNARSISRLRVGPDETLTNRDIYGPERLEGFPEGYAFDRFGNLWVTLIMTEKMIAITPDGDVLTLPDDGSPDTTAELYRQRDAGTLPPATMRASQGELAPWMASITLGRRDLKTLYLGSLLGNQIPSFRSTMAGQPLIH